MSTQPGSRPRWRSIVGQSRLPGTGLDQWLRETDAAEHRLEQLIQRHRRRAIRQRRPAASLSPGINPDDFEAAKALLDPYHALLEAEAPIGPGLAP